ncbi:type 1 glutamine amidotransferase [Candidatus Nomurabacteria bacterium]|nr:type 1 glutamine amidotransferase [Candidatus Nomurabacteria bacterium]
MKSKEDLKILLLQIREDEITLQEEYENFLLRANLKAEQLVAYNIFFLQSFDQEIVNDFDAVFIGGSSDVTVTDPEKFPFLSSAYQLLQKCAETNIPVFASCFGIQMLSEAFGGKVIIDKDNKELGTFRIYLEPEAREDHLLSHLPETFLAVLGHKERIERLPENFVVLAKSKKCPYQIIRMQDKPIYGFQFHPEMNKKDFVNRLERYQTVYVDDQNSLQNIIDQAEDTPEANQLLKIFLEKIVING